jgi:uncharacterized protein YndB with AHSA1/START domain
VRKVTVAESLFVEAPPERVWDFTQDYAQRASWDANVLDAEVLPGDGAPRVRVRMRGGVRCTFRYQAFERPQHTSLAMVDVQSVLFVGGGGAWTYESRDGGTLWTQTNTLVLADRWFAALLAPLVRWQLRRSTVRAMRAAQRLLER